MLLVTVQEGGVKYRRAWVQGPETYRATGWVELVVPEANEGKGA